MMNPEEIIVGREYWNLHGEFIRVCLAINDFNVHMSGNVNTGYKDDLWFTIGYVCNYYIPYREIKLSNDIKEWIDE